MPKQTKLDTTYILERLAEGQSQSAIAREYGVSRQALHEHLRKKGLLEKAKLLSEGAKNLKYSVNPSCPHCDAIAWRYGYMPDGRHRYICSDFNHCGITFSEKATPKPQKPAPNKQAQRMREYRERKRQRERDRLHLASTPDSDFVVYRKKND